MGLFPSQLVRRLLARPLGHLHPLEIVRWWELRRLPYNAIVGAVGIVSAAIMIAVAFTCESRGGAPIGLPDPPLFAIAGVLLYGILANLCYTGGWVVELLVMKVWHVASSGPQALGLRTLHGGPRNRCRESRLDCRYTG